MNDQPKKEVKDTRTQPRFVFKEPVAATYNAYPITILNLSGGGAAIEHFDLLKLHSAAKLVVPLPGSSEMVTLRGKLVWSRLSRTPNRAGKNLYHSGLRFEGPLSNLTPLTDRIISLYGAEVDEQSFQRKIEMLRERTAKDAERQRQTLDSTWRRIPAGPPPIDPEQALLIEHAGIRLRNNQEEIVRLASRARKILEQRGEGFSYSDEILAVWEYLERVVPVGVVSEVLSKGKK